MALRPTPALPPLKSCDCSLLFKDTISLGHLPWHLICFWWPCRDVAIHMGNWISLWPALPKRSHSFSFIFSLSLSLAYKPAITTCTVGREGLLWLSHPCVLTQEITQMIGHTNGPPVFLRKHFDLCLWDKADDVTSHIYYSFPALLIHTFHIYCFPYWRSSIVFLFVQQCIRKYSLLLFGYW